MSDSTQNSGNQNTIAQQEKQWIEKNQKTIINTAWLTLLVFIATPQSTASVLGGYALSYILRRAVDNNYQTKSGIKLEESVLTIPPRMMWNKKPIEFDIGQALDMSSEMIGKRGTAVIVTAFGPQVAIPYIAYTLYRFLTKDIEIHDPYAIVALALSAGAAAMTGGSTIYAPLLATAMCFGFGAFMSYMSGQKYDKIKISDEVKRQVGESIMTTEEQSKAERVVEQRKVDEVGAVVV